MTATIKECKRTYLRWSHPKWAQDVILELEDDPTVCLKRGEDNKLLTFRFVSMTPNQYERLQSLSE